MASTKKLRSSLVAKKGRLIEEGVDAWAKRIKWRAHWLRKSYEPLNAAIDDCLEIIKGIDETFDNNNAFNLSAYECALIYNLNKYLNIDERELVDDLNQLSKAVADLIAVEGFLRERALIGFASLVLKKLYVLKPVIGIFGLNEADGIDTSLVANTVSVVFRKITLRKRRQAGKASGKKAHAEKRKASAKLKKEVQCFAKSIAKYDLEPEDFAEKIRAKFASDIQNAGNISENTVLDWAKEAIKRSDQN